MELCESLTRQHQSCSAKLFLEFHALSLRTELSRDNKRLLETLAAFLLMRHDLAAIRLAMMTCEGDLAERYFARLTMLELIETTKKARQQIGEIIPVMNEILADREVANGLARSKNDLDALWKEELSRQAKIRNRIAHRDRLPAKQVENFLQSVLPSDASRLSAIYLDATAPVVAAVEAFAVAFNKAVSTLLKGDSVTDS